MNLSVAIYCVEVSSWYDHSARDWQKACLFVVERNMGAAGLRRSNDQFYIYVWRNYWFVILD